MQGLIFSLLVTGSIFVPHASLAQHYGGQYYPPTPHRYWQQNQFGGDTVIHDGRVLTNNLPPNTDTCNWVRNQGLSCQYERWDSRTRTHYVRSINNWGNDWNNNSGSWNNQRWRHPRPIWQNNSGCVYQNQHVRILCN